MERGQTVIDTESDVLKDLERKSVDDANVRHLVTQLNEAILILERIDSDPQEYDEADLERIIPNIQEYIEKIFRETKDKKLDRAFISNKHWNVISLTLAFVALLIVVLYHALLSLNSPGVMTEEERRQLKEDLLKSEDYIMFQEILRNGKYNPRFNPFYSILKRDGEHLPESIEATKEFIDEGNYKAAAYTLDTVLRHIRGAVREI